MSDDTSLPSLFATTKTHISNLDTLDPRSTEFATLLSTAQHTLVQCAHLIRQLSLFSPNEELEDLTTSSIPYLSIPYYQSDLTLRSYDPTNRSTQLSQATEFLRQFLQNLQNYSLLTAGDEALFERFKETPEFRLNSNLSAEAARNQKVQRFRDERAIKANLETLRAQKAEDEIVRKVYIAELQLQTYAAFSSLDGITQEREILKLAPPPGSSSVGADGRDSDGRNGLNGRSKDGYSDRLDAPPLSSQPILDANGRPLRPFTITSKRTDLRKGVFRPGHSLPTMSIDEYLEEEAKRGGIIEGGGPASEVVQTPDEDDIAAVDAATVKAREWDEFVEANPKGAGNTLNRG